MNNSTIKQFQTVVYKALYLINFCTYVVDSSQVKFSSFLAQEFFYKRFNLIFLRTSLSFKVICRKKKQ